MMTNAEIDAARTAYEARCADAEALQRKIFGIAEQLRTQDNLGTDAPMWLVQQRKRDYGSEDGHCDNFEWNDVDDWNAANDKQTATLNRMQERGWDTGRWKGIGYIDRWEFVTACFTRKGCEDYIASNGHNLCEPRIYADSSYRNEEFRAVREFLMRI